VWKGFLNNFWKVAHRIIDATESHRLPDTTTLPYGTKSDAIEGGPNDISGLSSWKPSTLGAQSIILLHSKKDPKIDPNKNIQTFFFNLLITNFLAEIVAIILYVKFTNSPTINPQIPQTHKQNCKGLTR